MNNDRELIKKVINLIKRDKLLSAFEMASKINDKPLNSAINQLNQRFSSNEKNNLLGIIGYEDYSREKSRITNAFLTFISDLQYFDESDLKYIVGFDLGDGESSISFTELTSKKEPIVFQVRKNEKSQITALARDGNGNWLIGEDALKLPKPYYLSNRFKSKPNTNSHIPISSDFRDLMTFAEVFFQKFLEKENLIEYKDNMKVYIGHPSGWQGEPSQNYQYHFENNRFIPNVFVVPESRAAFIQVKDKRIIKDVDLDSVLVIDIGSSTTDFTHVLNLEVEDLELGDSFGIGLLDNVVRSLVIDSCSNKDEVANRLLMYQEESSQLDLLCRKFKEYLFSNKDVSEISLDNISPWVVSNIWNNCPVVTKRELLGYEIPSIKTNWENYFTSLLSQAKEHIGDNLDVILLTGGGSRAKFTMELCKKVFGVKVKVKIDTEPHLCVSKGLARYGRWRFKVNKFYQVLSNFCRSRELMSKIDENSNNFLENLKGLEISSDLVENVWRPIIINGLQFKYKPDDYNYMTMIKRKTFEWLVNSEEGKKQWSIKSKDFVDSITPFIQSRTTSICQEYEIEPTKLFFHLEIPPDLWENEWDFFDKSIDKVFKFIYKMAYSNISNKNKKEIEEFINRKWIKTILDIYFTTGGIVADGVKFVGEATAKVFGVKFSTVKERNLIDFRNRIVLQIEHQLKSQARKVEKYLD